jgi:hypothetical protein
MAATTKPALYLIKNENANKKRQPKAPSGSSVVIEVERGQLRGSLVNALTAEDAIALLSGLAMALVQVVHAQQVL